LTAVDNHVLQTDSDNNDANNRWDVILRSAGWKSTSIRYIDALESKMTLGTWHIIKNLHYTKDTVPVIQSYTDSQQQSAKADSLV